MAKRNKPGWGRVFSDRCPYQDDAIYWKLYDLIMLRDANAIFKIKGPHRLKPNNNKGRKGKNKNDNAEREIDRPRGDITEEASEGEQADKEGSQDT